MIPALIVPPALVAIGFLLQRRTARTPRALLWAALVLLVVAAERWTAGGPPLERMAAMSVVAFLVLKVMVREEEKTSGMPPLTLGRWLEFTLLWVGMRPRLFSAPRRDLPDVARLFARGAAFLAAGLVAVGVARHLPWPRVAPAVAGAGLLLTLHFGLGTILAAAWRARGVRCEPIVREPLRSRNLAEFWSRRWNLVYSEMCATVVSRPLEGRLGRGWSVLLAFLVSGLLHDMAISLPVHGGYGLPTLYFALHGLLVLLEEALARRGRPIRGLFGRIWTALWILAPLPLLFHRPFVTQILHRYVV